LPTSGVGSEDATGESADRSATGVDLLGTLPLKKRPNQKATKMKTASMRKISLYVVTRALMLAAGVVAPWDSTA